MHLNNSYNTKFHVGNIKNYTGKDLIFLVGCPGSKWSSVYITLSKSSDINTTEWKDNFVWNMPIKNVHGEHVNIGRHRGVYWGPGNGFGNKFDELFTMTKAEILDEFMKPFDNWEKIKVIKSHWFAYHIDYLHALFPEAKIVSCYANDIDSFYWWHKCGGWGILFPNYSWYVNDSRMLEKIKEENYRLLRFNKSKEVSFKSLMESEFYELLGLSPAGGEDETLKSDVAIYDGSFIPNFNHIIR